MAEVAEVAEDEAVAVVVLGLWRKDFPKLDSITVMLAPSARTHPDLTTGSGQT